MKEGEEIKERRDFTRRAALSSPTGRVETGLKVQGKVEGVKAAASRRTPR